MTIEDLFDKCYDKYANKDFKGVIEICDEILSADLNNQIALEYKARSLYHLDKHEEALKLLDNAIMLYPNNYRYLDIKADVLMDKEEYDKVAECYSQVLEIGVDDEVELDFIKLGYITCLSLRIDQLIEMEKYVDAWNCYCLELELDSVSLKRHDAINRFKRYVAEYTTRIKSRKYFVRISSNGAKDELIEFLDKNGFKSKGCEGMLFLIDVVDKTYDSVSIEEIGLDNIISESKFYDKVNYYPRGKIISKMIFAESGELLYEGYTLHGAPYGFGKAYFSNGNLFREGIFDIKGIVQGREYYPSGQIRFEGRWCLTRGYGPNAPCDGDAYGEDGELIYSGKFEIKRGGVGWPMIQKPKGFACEQKQRPKIKYY